MVGTAVAGIAAVSLPEFLPPALRVGLVFVFCGLGGAAAAFIPAFFKRVSGVNEVITGMIANLLIPYLISAVVGAFPALRAARGAASGGIPQSAWLAQISELPLGELGEGTKANISILIGIGLTLALAYLLKRSRLGYEIRMSRQNPYFAEFGGIRVGRMFFVSMMLSGAIAAMAGATEVLGVWRQASYGTLAVGNKGLVLALAGGNNFMGAALASMLYGGLEAGAMSASWATSVQRPLIDILVQILFLLAALPSMRRFFTGASHDSAENLGGSFLRIRN
jgi:simple sugar transport system permease protein